MKWQDKMEAVLIITLGDAYRIEFVSDCSYKIAQNDKVILSSICNKETASHWEESIKDNIHILIDLKIKKAYKHLEIYDGVPINVEALDNVNLNQ
jgi:hypothetical protein